MKNLMMSFFHFSAHLTILAENPEGRPPPSSGQYPDEFNQSMSDIARRAFKFPDMFLQFESLMQHFMLVDGELKGTQSLHDLHDIGAKGHHVEAC